MGGACAYPPGLGGRATEVRRDQPLGPVGAGTSAQATTYSVGGSPSALALADANRDGILDVVVAQSGANAVSVLLGTGATSGTFFAPDPAGRMIPRFQLAR